MCVSLARSAVCVCPYMSSMIAHLGIEPQEVARPATIALDGPAGSGDLHADGGEARGGRRGEGLVGQKGGRGVVVGGGGGGGVDAEADRLLCMRVRVKWLIKRCLHTVSGKEHPSSSPPPPPAIHYLQRRRPPDARRRREHKRQQKR